MTRALVLLGIVAALSAFGCKKDDGKGGGAASSSASSISPAAPAGGASGAKECDEYATKMQACFAKMSEDERAEQQPAFEATKEAWAQEKDKAALARSCKQALTTLPANCK